MERIPLNVSIYTAYVDTNLVGSGKISKAAIIGLQGGVWASSPGYEVRTKSCTLRQDINLIACFRDRDLFLQISPGEQAAIITALKNSEEATAKGVRLADQKFFVLQADAEKIYGKKQVRSGYSFHSTTSPYIPLIHPSTCRV